MRGFPVGTVVPPEDLVGREKAIADLGHRLKAGQHLYIAAPRQVGKTSVTDEVLRRLAREGWPAIPVMLMGISSWSELAESLTASTLRAGGTSSRALGNIRRDLSALGGRLLSSTITLSSGPTGEMSLSLGPAKHKDGRALLTEALNLPELLGQRTGRRVVVCFDEFQKIVRLPDDLPGFLRSIIIRHQYVSYLFLGSRTTMLQELFTAENQPLHRFAGAWELPPVPGVAWTSYLREKYAALGVEAEVGAIRELLRQTGGHPYDTMAVAQEGLVFCTAPSHSPAGRLTVDDVDLAFQNALASRAQVFQVEWDRLAPAAQEILKRLSTDRPVWTQSGERGTPNPNEIRIALASLIDEGVLLHPRRGVYHFFEYMFQEYVRQLASSTKY